MSKTNEPKVPEFDEQKIDDAVLALLFLSLDSGNGRAWKSHDWDAMNRLHEHGLIGDPKSKAKSVVLTEEGTRLAEANFRRFFGR